MTLHPDAPPLPESVRELAEVLAALPGATAVALAGSRAAGDADGGSDWDLTVYYRGSIELGTLEAYGEVHPPGAWGRIMNGGAWLQVGGVEVDLILRDLDVALHWTRQAEAGVFEVDLLLGYLAGVPTYLLAGELASGRLLAGELPAVGAVPPRLAETAPPRWRFARDFSLDYARMHAARGNVAGAAGQAAKAAMEEAHARLCERGQWALNEKRLLAMAGLDALGDAFTRPPAQASALGLWVDEIARALAKQPPPEESR
ncbi:MAG TPA: nucleotidyltransferase domain-containing protein [Longimicrobium sp.]